VTALIPSILDSPPVSFPSTVDVATLSLFSVKARTLFLRKVAKASQIVAALVGLTFDLGRARRKLNGMADLEAA
jgi:hypothetical protein